MPIHLTPSDVFFFTIRWLLMTWRLLDDYETLQYRPMPPLDMLFSFSCELKHRNYAHNSTLAPGHNYPRWFDFEQFWSPATPTVKFHAHGWSMQNRLSHWAFDKKRKSEWRDIWDEGWEKLSLFWFKRKESVSGMGCYDMSFCFGELRISILWITVCGQADTANHRAVWLLCGFEPGSFT